jgi:hypothetical protein
VYSATIWRGLPPPKAPNIWTSLTPLKRHTSTLHIRAPFSARLKQGYANGVINLPRLRALEAALERCFAAATLLRCTGQACW